MSGVPGENRRVTDQLDLEQPTTFDWVRHRAHCNVREMFEKLAEVVAADVKAAEEVVAGRHFVLEANALDIFHVKRVEPPDPNVIDGRRFRLQDSRIIVRDLRGKDILSARVALVHHDCLLDVDSQTQPLRLWQFSRLALESLFFG